MGAPAPAQLELGAPEDAGSDVQGIGATHVDREHVLRPEREDDREARDLTRVAGEPGLTAVEDALHASFAGGASICPGEHDHLGGRGAGAEREPEHAGQQAHSSGRWHRTTLSSARRSGERPSASWPKIPSW